METPSPLPLSGKHVALGVTGSISAFKAADLASKLRQAGATVEVVMTPAATQFVTPLTFQSLTGRPVVVDMFAAAEAEAHVEVARRADVFVIAPATADCLARLAHGMTSDMVTLTALATTAPILLAPAMDNQMWEHPATQENVTTLRNRGVEFVGPMEGRLASGRSGLGRLAEVPQVVGAVRMLIGQRSGDLAGRHIVVSAGGTQEPLDPVRYVGNRSTGKMGFAIAEAARDRGAHVTLVTGPVALETPYGIHRVDVNTVAEMLVALEQATADSDAIIMSAAPADYRPANPSAHKLKKSSDEGALDIELVKNPDIIATLPAGGVRVGFAAETRNLEEYARQKLPAKRLDFIVANDVSAAGSGFGTDTNQVTIFHSDGRHEELPMMTKYAVGLAILDRVAARLSRGASR
ncbi:bifunctional phosphopantothenoylcysteine decarboxylase/phosphopantothenate--cysteine ligase CoaBC [Candidatus Amarobacter glycogenicus]|uniref:bifunctional phosphopantothenoylcysteine decarboxylase/phosphopantothenate--cysteine ligase CoaBC n=1 Tax=Candidatus Amarobacter glycogenicus TaxID=3140699 RepID=UPI003134DCC2|nr:bifunctional phosphopantothenoylcysteine decarboxylase/phosphopantothenate--cysteine ligase CoaBC [Dehalococcoidia bacterium]